MHRLTCFMFLKAFHCANNNSLYEGKGAVATKMLLSMDKSEYVRSISGNFYSEHKEHSIQFRDGW